MRPTLETLPVSSSRQRHPAIELLARYAAIGRAAWACRHELAGPRRLADELAFLPAALSLQDTPVHPAPRRLAWSLMTLFVLALLWAVFGSVDIVAVAPGRIIVDERTKVIQPLERGVVRRILVKDGEHVRAGQVLIELDPTAAQADKSGLQEARRAAESDALRSQVLLRSLSTAGPVARTVEIRPQEVPSDWSERDRAQAQSRLAAEWSEITARLARLEADHARRKAEQATVSAVVDKLESTLPMARQREEDFQALTMQGFVSGHAGQDRMRERIELERDLHTQGARLLEALASVREAGHARAAYLAETRHALRERQAQAELQRHQTAQELAKVSQRESLASLIAPVAGTVQQLAIHTEGGVVTEAQALLVIVPEDAELSAEVSLENKDIGFVERGQDVTLKLEPFPFTRYGTVAGKVEKVTQDAVHDDQSGSVFPAVVRLAQTYIHVEGKPVRISPGMNVIAEIRTGRRRVIEYLLSPIQRAGNESLRER